MDAFVLVRRRRSVASAIRLPALGAAFQIAEAGSFAGSCQVDVDVRVRDSTSRPVHYACFEALASTDLIGSLTRLQEDVGVRFEAEHSMSVTRMLDPSLLNAPCWGLFGVAPSRLADERQSGDAGDVQRNVTVCGGYRAGTLEVLGSTASW